MTSREIDREALFDAMKDFCEKHGTVSGLEAIADGLAAIVIVYVDPASYAAGIDGVFNRTRYAIDKLGEKKATVQ